MEIKITVYDENTTISKRIAPLRKERTLLEYTPSKTCSKFMLAESMYRALLGPISSGKTIAAAMDLFRRACSIAPNENGVRGSRVFVLARHYKDTVLNSVKFLFPPIIWKWYEHEQCLVFKFNDVESTWYFSQDECINGEYTWVWVEQAVDMPVKSIKHMSARMGRYPRRTKDYGVLLTSVVPDPGEKGEKFRTFLKDVNAEVFVQPSGLSPEAENIDNLMPDYYKKVAVGKSQAWINRYIHAKF